MTTTAPRRGGFTLIELLVVMALLAILAAIAAGAFFRVRANAEVSSTQSNLEKLNSGIDRKWKAVLDQAAIEAQQGRVPAAITSYCNEDKDRIRVVWTYMKLKNEFPTSVAEATNPVVLNGYSLPSRSIYSPLAGYTGDAFEQSAACLFLSLTQSAVGGEVFDVTPLQSQVRNVKNAQVFVDSWGKPIVFVRMAYPNEVNTTPYTQSPKDPIDTIGKLNSWAGNASLWDAIRGNHISYSNPIGFPGTAGTVPIRNWVPSCVSFGPNETPGTLFGNDAVSSDLGNDNLISFRLRRAGMKGN